MNNEQKRELVNALLACSTMSDRNTRDAVVTDLSEDIKTNVRRHSIDRVDVTNIVTTCLNYTNGLEQLIESVRFYERDSIGMQQVDKVWSRIAKPDVSTDEPIQTTPSEINAVPSPSRSELESPSLKELWEIPKCYLWGQFILLLLFLVGVIEGLVGIFDIPPCPRRSVLTVCTILGGGAILGLSFIYRYRSRYQARDRWLTSGLLVIAIGILGLLTYSVCISSIPSPTSTIPPPDSNSTLALTPTPEITLNIKLDEKITQDEQTLTRNTNFIRIEAEILSDGTPIPPRTFEYKWSFNPPDTQNQDKDWSRVNVISYNLPPTLEYQTLTIQVRGIDQQRSKSIHFIIKE